MSLLRAVVTELFGMFLADARLAFGALIVIAVAAVLVGALPSHPLAAGVVLLVGCLVILVAAAGREARRSASE